MKIIVSKLSAVTEYLPCLAKFNKNDIFALDSED